MSCNRLRKDDPIFYKCALAALLREAKENGLMVSLGESGAVTTLYFENDVGEKAGMELLCGTYPAPVSAGEGAGNERKTDII